MSKATFDYEPIAMKAGDNRVLLNGEPVSVDFRVVAETYYEELIDIIHNVRTIDIPGFRLPIELRKRIQAVLEAHNA